MPDLLGKALPQSFDTQAELARIAQALGISQAMLGAGLKGGPTGMMAGEGPLARYVPDIGGSIAKGFQAYLGAKGMGEAADAQGKLASLVMQRDSSEQSEVDKLLNPPPYPIESPGPPAPDGMPAYQMEPGRPDIVGAISRALISPSEKVQARGNMLEAARIKAEEQSMVKPPDIAALTHFNTPQSVTEALQGSKTLLGGSKLDTSKLRMKPIESSRGPGQETSLLDPNPGGGISGVQTNRPKNEILSPGQKDEDGKVINPTADFMTRDSNGNLQILNTSNTEAQKEVAKSMIPKLEKGLELGNQFAQNLPKLQEMYRLIDNIDTGYPGAEWVTKARQVAMAFGLSKDEAGKITDTQTFLKFGIPQAAHALKEFSSRPTQAELVTYSNIMAANQSVTPQAARNIVMGLMLDGANTVEQHRSLQKSLEKLPTLANMTQLYNVKGYKDVEDITGPLDSHGARIKVTQNASGMWKNDAISPHETKSGNTAGFTIEFKK